MQVEKTAAVGRRASDKKNIFGSKENDGKLAEQGIEVRIGGVVGLEFFYVSIKGEANFLLNPFFIKLGFDEEKRSLFVNELFEVACEMIGLSLQEKALLRGWFFLERYLRGSD